MVTITRYTGTATEFTIPATINGKTVKAIGNGAFAHFTSLENETIPSSVTSIGDDAFRRCTSLGIIFLPNDISIGLYLISETTTQTEYSVSEANEVTIVKCTSNNTTVIIPEKISARLLLLLDELL